MTEFYIPHKNTTEHWYQEPWMLLVLGGPAIVVIAALFTFYIAWQGSDNVLTKDYYKQGVNIDKDIHRDAKAGEYKIEANAKIDSPAGNIQIQLKGKTILPATILLVASSYARGSEFEAIQKITLTQSKSGLYEGLIKLTAPSDSINLNLWHIKIEGDNWRLTAEWHDPLHTTLQLKASN